MKSVKGCLVWIDLAARLDKHLGAEFAHEKRVAMGIVDDGSGNANGW